MIFSLATEQGKNVRLLALYRKGGDVFFSAPLDIDFLMLEHYGEVHKDLLGEKEGPRLMIKEEGKDQQKYIKDIEKLPLKYADLILNGDPERYLKAVTEYNPLNF